MKSLFNLRIAGVALAALLATSLAAPGQARAEGRIRIAEQFGISYLPLHVIRDQRLIEKHGKDQGLEIAVEWAKLSGGASIAARILRSFSSSARRALRAVSRALRSLDRSAFPWSLI